MIVHVQFVVRVQSESFAVTAFPVAFASMPCVYCRLCVAAPCRSRFQSLVGTSEDCSVSNWPDAPVNTADPPVTTVCVTDCSNVMARAVVVAAARLNQVLASLMTCVVPPAPSKVTVPELWVKVPSRVQSPAIVKEAALLA